MSRIDCFTKHAPELEKQFKKMVDDGMPEMEAAKKLVDEKALAVSKELNDFKKLLDPTGKKIKRSDYTPKDVSKEVETKKAEYQNQIDEIKNAQLDAIRDDKQKEQIKDAIKRSPTLESEQLSKSISNIAKIPIEEARQLVSEVRGEQPKPEAAPEPKTESSGGGAKVPPTQEKIAEPQSMDSDWTSIRQEKLKEIDGVKQVFERETKRKWSDIQQAALEKVMAEYPDKSLYDAVKQKTLQLSFKYDNKEDYNPTAMDLAVIQEFKRQTEKKIAASEKTIKEGNDFDRMALMLTMDGYKKDLVSIAKATFKKEAGTAFGYRQSEVKESENYGLQLRRMELMKAQGGKELTPEQDKWVSSQWEKEKELMNREAELRAKAIKEDFEYKIQKMQDEFDKKISELKTKSGEVRSIKQIGKDIANKIRSIKLSKGSTKLDFTLGTYDIAIEGIAKLVEGGATIAEAIEKLVKDGVIGFRAASDKSKLEEHILIGISKKHSTEDAFENIKTHIGDKGNTEITNEMVSKNLIKDFVDSYIGDVPQKEILETAHKKLLEILPETTKEQIAEAYVKKGIFKQETKAELKNKLLDKQRELAKIAKSELNTDQEQRIKLQETKDRVLSEIRRIKKDIENGNFDDKPSSVVLTKADAELIKLNKEKSLLEAQYNKEKENTIKQNKSSIERLADFTRAAYVGLLIGGLHTFEKIASMSVARPFSEAATKATFGKLFNLWFPNISKAALGGGESSSNRSIVKGMEAYFMNIGNKAFIEKINKSEREYNIAVDEYNKYKNGDNVNDAVLNKLRKNVNDKLLKATGNFVYQFIGTSSIKDATKALVNRVNEIEANFSSIEKESIKDGDIMDKVSYILNFIGRSHSALKTFSGRFSFASSFMARLEKAANEDVDLGNSDRILEIAHESYLDWERGKYQQSNYISDKWNQLLASTDKKMSQNPEWDKYNKSAKALLKTEVAITRVPVNILHEAVMEYTVGAFRAVSMAIKEYNKAKKSALNDYGLVVNSPEFKNKVKELVSNMDEKQAATIVRCFRKGSMGMGLYALSAISGMIAFGTFPHLGQKKKKEESQLGKKELNPGQVMIGDDKLGEAASGMISHVPALWPMFMGAGMSHIYNSDIRAGKKKPKAAWDALYTHLKIMEGGIPQFKLFSPSDLAIKPMVRTVGKRLDDWGITDKDVPVKKAGKRPPSHSSEPPSNNK